MDDGLSECSEEKDDDTDQQKDSLNSDTGPMVLAQGHLEEEKYSCDDKQTTFTLKLEQTDDGGPLSGANSVGPKINIMGVENPSIEELDGMNHQD